MQADVTSHGMNGDAAFAARPAALPLVIALRPRLDGGLLLIGP